MSKPTSGTNKAPCEKCGALLVWSFGTYWCPANHEPEPGDSHAYRTEYQRQALKRRQRDWCIEQERLGKPVVKKSPATERCPQCGTTMTWSFGVVWCPRNHMPGRNSPVGYRDEYERQQLKARQRDWRIEQERYPDADDCTTADDFYDETPEEH